MEEKNELAIISETKRDKNRKTKSAEFVQTDGPLELNPNMPLGDQESLQKLWQVINSGKSYAQVLDYVDNEIKESTRTIAFAYQIKCFLCDGAYALHRSVQNKIGFSRQQDRKGPSGAQNPPQMLDVTLSDGTHKKVPYGKIDLPMFGEKAFVEMNYDSGNQTLHVNGQCQKRYNSDLDEIIDKTKHILATDSIYRGQAIKFVKGAEPTFINLDSIESQNMYLTSAARHATTPIEARITKTQKCIDNNIDIKFGVLLEGDYGTGKTLYAFKLAAKAVTHGWTFIYCENSQDTLEAMKMSHRYCKNGRGVVLFIEDIDKILNVRDNTTNEISVLMDGGETKNNNIITIFTTNHLSRINPTFLRGKRIGTIVTLTHPDVPTAAEMLTRTLVDEEGKSVIVGDITEAAKKIVEYKIVPAFIAEIVDRLKTYQIFSDKATVSQQDILDAVDTYQRQIQAAKLQEDNPTDAENLAEALRAILQVKNDEALAELRTKVDIIFHEMGYTMPNES